MEEPIGGTRVDTRTYCVGVYSTCSWDMLNLYKGENQDKYNHLLNLEFIKAEIYRGLDSNSAQPPVSWDIQT